MIEKKGSLSKGGKRQAAGRYEKNYFLVCYIYTTK